MPLCALAVEPAIRIKHTSNVKNLFIRLNYSSVLRENNRKDTLKGMFINNKWLIIPNKSKLETELNVHIGLYPLGWIGRICSNDACLIVQEGPISHPEVNTAGHIPFYHAIDP